MCIGAESEIPPAIRFISFGIPGMGPKTKRIWLWGGGQFSEPSGYRPPTLNIESYLET